MSTLMIYNAGLVGEYPVRQIDARMTERKATDFLARVYEMSGEPGNRTVLVERPFPTAQAATNFIGPYIMKGYPFDIWSPGYNGKDAS